jgi:glutathione S-transferase
MTNLLVTIPFSHFCEKARWSLDRCGVTYREEGHAPLFHFLPARRAGGNRTVPVLRTSEGRVIADSTDIAAWADTHKPGALLGDAAALAFEDDFDRQLGPAARRWGYFQLLPRRDSIELMRGHVPDWEVRVLRVVRPVAMAMMRRAMNVTPAGAARSRDKIDATFARVGELLADGRRYLAGGRFTIADLTFAALAAPILRPAQNVRSFPAELVLSPEATAQVAAWRATPAGQFALRIYAEER